MSEQGKRRAINVQLHIKAPTGTPAEIIRRAILYKCETGQNTPAIEITIIDWTGRDPDREINQEADFWKLRHAIKRAHIRAGREG
jgi:hypothetical protein